MNTIGILAMQLPANTTLRLVVPDRFELKITPSL